ncbi:MAG: hypothetical protein QGG53_09615 [Planctomycetota bacterium]|jgi:hypothetical protein|nr:hypothetical protein [Planctomycetota bacterium]
MGSISRKLNKRFARRGYAPPSDIDFEKEVPPPHVLEMRGYDPLHAGYVSAQNFVSVFSELGTEFPELDEYATIVAQAEEEYLPGGPPHSPITSSHFTTWAFFDLQFGPDNETLGTCLLSLTDFFPESPLRNVVQLFHNTRMGIYQVTGKEAGKVILRELLTHAQYPCLLPTGYDARPGELLYTRLCPPYEDDFGYYVAFTSPYVLINYTADDWTAYLRRTLIHATIDNFEQELHQLMKFGPSRHYWNEFIFEAYHHHQDDAIFLTGLPDVKGSLPHADLDDMEG